MALPTDLVRTLLKQIPFSRFASTSKETLRAWCQICQPALLQALQQREKGPSGALFYSKVASWAGCAMRNNGLFLPSYLILVNSIQADDDVLFDDWLSCCYFSDKIFRLVLRQLGRTAAAEKILARLLAGIEIYTDEYDINIMELVDDIILGKIKLTTRALQMLVASFTKHDNNLDCREFFTGALVALSVATTELPYGYYYQLGYLANGGKSETMIGISAVTIFNQPVLFFEEIALFELAHWSIEQLPRDGQRAFPLILMSAQDFHKKIPQLPGVTGKNLFHAVYDYLMIGSIKLLRKHDNKQTVDVRIHLRDLGILRPRAAVLLPLIPQIYAASVARAKYLALLELIVFGQAELSNDETSKKLRYMSGLITKMSELSDYETCSVENPIRLVQQIDTLADAPDGVIRQLLHCAVLGDCLPELVTILFRREPNWFTTFTKGDDNNYLESLLVFLQSPRPSELTVHRSVLLESLLPRLQFLGLKLRNFAGDETVAELIFMSGNVQIENQASAHEYRRWRQLGLPLPPLLNPDRVRERTLALLQLT